MTYKWLFVLAVTFCGGCANRQAATDAATPTVRATIQPTPTFGQILDEVAAQKAKLPHTPIPEVRAVEFSPDRKWLAIGTLVRTSPFSGTVAVRSCADNRIVKTWKVPGGVRYLKFSPNGKNVAATGPANKIWVWQWNKGALLYSSVINAEDDQTGQMPIAYAPDGRTIAVGADGIQFIDTKNWSKRSPDLQSLVSDVAYSPDSRFLLASDGDESYDGYTIYPQPRGKERKKTYFSPRGAPVFSRDGKSFAARATDEDKGKFENTVDALFLFETRTLKTKRTLKMDGGFVPTDFSPDGKLLAGLDVETPEIWDIKRGKRVQRFGKFEQSARALVWLDAKTLLAGDENGVHRLTVN